MNKGLREDAAEKVSVSPTANAAVAACTPVTLVLGGGKLNLVTQPHSKRPSRRVVQYSSH